MNSPLSEPAGAEALPERAKPQLVAPEGDLTPIVGANVRRLRLKRGLSLERLAKSSGVSRAMLGQIELGQSTPTINILWKIARALDVSFSALVADATAQNAVILKRSNARLLRSSDGSFTSRALFPVNASRSTEFYELHLAPGCLERGEPHPPGTLENLVVASGALQVSVGTRRYSLEAGDAITFQADVAHEYLNSAREPAVVYLVMTYAERAP
ncbi:MAG TPA: XRE family transcriptional regulator [Polyangiaceae bacterium]|nr:XRE family transcriptional regulator [Polyangiaceae bacterium]